MAASSSGASKGGGPSSHSSFGLGDEVPDFNADSQLGKINFHDYCTGQWVMLFSHPADYNPVGTTELGTVAKLKKEFEARNTKIISLSVDTLEHHEGWIKDVNETQGSLRSRHFFTPFSLSVFWLCYDQPCALSACSLTSGCEVDFPIIADKDGSIAKQFGMVFPKQIGALSGQKIARTIMIIDPNRRVQLRMDYPIFAGRNFFEVLRIIDALQLTMYHKVATPANWKQGENVLVLQSVSDQQAKALFPKGFTPIKSYLRVTPPPDM